MILTRTEQSPLVVFWLALGFGIGDINVDLSACSLARTPMAASMTSKLSKVCNLLSPLCALEDR